MKSFKRSLKGISPIFATLILIAIAVIAGVVVYAFTSGMLGNMTNTAGVGQEKAAIQSAGGTGTTVTAYAQYISGGSNIAINGAIIKDAAGPEIQGTVTGSLTTDGALVKLTVTAASTLTAGHQYTVTFTTSHGNSFISPSFTAT